MKLLVDHRERRMIKLVEDVCEEGWLRPKDYLGSHCKKSLQAYSAVHDAGRRFQRGDYGACHTWKP